MPREKKFDGMEPGDGGGLYLPGPPTFILHKDLHSELEDYDLEDEFEFRMMAKVIQRRSDGTFEVELTQIQVPKRAAIERARKKVEGPLGVLNDNDLKGIFE